MNIQNFWEVHSKTFRTFIEREPSFCYVWVLPYEVLIFKSNLQSRFALN